MGSSATRSLCRCSTPRRRMKMKRKRNLLRYKVIYELWNVQGVPEKNALYLQLGSWWKHFIINHVKKYKAFWFFRIFKISLFISHIFLFERNAVRSFFVINIIALYMIVWIWDSFSLKYFKVFFVNMRILVANFLRSHKF